MQRGSGTVEVVGRASRRKRPAPARVPARVPVAGAEDLLCAARVAREKVESDMAAAVRVARGAGWSWPRIGSALGIDPSTAFRRYRGA